MSYRMAQCSMHSGHAGYNDSLCPLITRRRKSRLCVPVRVMPELRLSRVTSNDPVHIDEYRRRLGLFRPWRLSTENHHATYETRQHSHTCVFMPEGCVVSGDIGASRRNMALSARQPLGSLPDTPCGPMAVQDKTHIIDWGRRLRVGPCLAGATPSNRKDLSAACVCTCVCERRWCGMCASACVCVCVCVCECVCTTMTIETREVNK